MRVGVKTEGERVYGDRLLVSKAGLASPRLEVNSLSATAFNLGHYNKSLSHKHQWLRAR